MELMKKVNALVLGLMMLLAFGCGKDDDDPDKIQPSVQQTKCLLSKKYVESNTQNKTLREEWFYDNNHKEIRHNDYFNRRYSLIEYDATGLIIKRTGFSMSDSSYVGEAIHTYNQNGNIISISNPSFGNRFTYDYNALNQLIKVSSFHSGVSIYPELFAKYYYPSNGQRIVENYSNNNNTPILTITQIYSFDNNPAPTTSATLKPFGNYTTLKQIVPGRADTIRTFFSHQYNEYGYPISTTFTVSTEPSNYYKTEYEYICF